MYYFHLILLFQVIVFCTLLAYSNAGFLGTPAVATYSAAPSFSYGAAAPLLGSTFHGSYAAAPATAVAYGTPTVAYGAPSAISAPAITSQSSNILRSFGNLGQVSTYSKTIDTPFSSVRKADVRVSNPGLRISAGPALSYAAPALNTYATSPIFHSAPALAVSHAAPTLAVGHASPVLGVAYSAAPAVSHLSYASAYANYGW